MSSNNQTETNGISKSKQKRMAQENARKEQHKKQIIRTFWMIFIPALIIAAIAGGIIYYKSLQVDYGKYLTADGKIEGNASTYITGSLDNFTIIPEDCMPNSYEIENQIEEVVDEHKTLDTTGSAAVMYGDYVNISYVATLNGEIYEQASIEEGGEDITIGDGDVEEEIDDALIGHVAGDTVSVVVEYPADHYDEELAGNSLTYDVTLAGIYNVPEFNDEFVQTYLASEATTASDYRQKLITDYYRDNIKDYIEDSISENCIVSQYPEKFLENTVKTTKAQDKENFAYYQQMYQQYGLTLTSIEQMYGLETPEEYSELVTENAKETVMKSLFYQKLMEDNNLSNTTEEVRAFFLSSGYDEASYDEAVNKYGYKYMANMALNGRMLDYACDQLMAKYPAPTMDDLATDSIELDSDDFVIE